MKKLFCILGTMLIPLFTTNGTVLSNGNPPATPKKDYNIVLITIDTLRADHLSCYGYTRKTSPTIDMIAREGVRYARAIATSPWTSPSVASIMTSLYSRRHGIIHGFKKSGNVFNQEVLGDQFTTMAEILKGHGYTTFASVSNMHMAQELGFGQGFDYYYCDGFHKAYFINNAVFSWEKRIKAAEKFFLWVHYFDPHEPYSAKSPWINDYAGERWIGNADLSEKTTHELKKSIPSLEKNVHSREYLQALYDSEISYVDYHLGRLLRRLVLDNNSIIIITSDHGEEFLDHGSFGHAHTLYQELLHVPLIIKLPFEPQRHVLDRSNEYVSIIDILPTILGVLGIAPPPAIEGKNLLGDEQALQHQQARPVFSELYKNAVTKTIIENNWKYIFDYRTRKHQLYNLRDDLKESHNLIDRETMTAEALKKELLEWAVTSAPDLSAGKETTITREMVDRLKSLGYVSDGE